MAGNFTPVLGLSGTTTIDPGASTFSCTGEVTSVIDNGGTPLSSSIADASIASLTGSGLTDLPGDSLSVAGVSFTLGSLAIDRRGAAGGTPQIQLQGSVALLDGLTVAVNGNNFVDIGSSGSSLTGISASLGGSLTVGGVSFNVSDLEVQYAAENNVFTVTGDSAVNVVGVAGLNVDFGGGSTAGLVITNGSLTSLDTTVNTQFAVEGVAFTASDLDFSYTGGTFTLTGGASVQIGNTTGDGFSLSAIFGTAALGTPGSPGYVAAQPGLVIDSSGTLDNLNLTVNSTFTVEDVTFTAAGLDLSYTDTDGGMFTLGGTASVQIGSTTGDEFSLGVTFGSAAIPASDGMPAVPAMPGLVITDTDGTAELDSLNTTVNSTFTVADVTFTAEDLDFSYTYTDPGYTFTLGGGASIQIGATTGDGFSLGVTFGTLAQPGLVIDNGTLENLNATVNSTFTVEDVTFTATDLDFSYANTNTGGIFNLSGSASVQIGDTTNGDGFSLGVTFGSAAIPASDGMPAVSAMPGLVIDDGTLEGLNSTVNSTFTVEDVTFTAQALDFSYAYTDPGYTFTLDGSASVQIGATTGDGFSLDVTFGTLAQGTPGSAGYVAAEPGLVINSGTLDDLNVTVNSTFTVEDVTFTAQALDFSYAYTDPGYTFTLGGSASVQIGETTGDGFSLDVTFGTLAQGTPGSTGYVAAQPGLVINSGTLDDLNVTVNSTFTVEDVTFTAQDLDFSYAYTDPGYTFTLDGGASVQIGATSGDGFSLDVTFGTLAQGTLGSPGYVAAQPGLVINSGTLDDLNVTVNSTFTVEDVSFTAQDLDFSYAYTDPGYIFALGGTASVQIGSQFSLGVTFGTAAIAAIPASTLTPAQPAMPAMPGLVIDSGTLESLNLTVNSTFTVGGVNFDSNGLDFDYETTKSGYSFELTGNAYVDVGSALSLSVTFGSLAQGTPGTPGYLPAQPGLVLTNTNGTVELDSLNATVNSSFTVGDVTFSTDGLDFNYQTTNPGYTFELTGNASVQVGSDLSLSVTFGSLAIGTAGTADYIPPEPGLVIDNGTLNSLNVTVTSSFTVGAVTFGTNGLDFDYETTTSGYTFELTGNAFVDVGSRLSLSVTFGSLALGMPGTPSYVPAQPGLVIDDTNGTVKLDSLNVTVTSSFTVGNVTFGTDGLDFSYVAKTDTFQMTGAAFVNFKVGLNTDKISVDFANDGLLISHGALVSLDVSVTSSFTVGKVTFATDGLAFSYTVATDTFQMTGAATVTVGGISGVPGSGDTVTVDFANNGLVITDGALVSLDVSITSSFMVGPVTFGTNGLEFSYVAATDTFQLTGTTFVMFGGIAGVPGQSGDQIDVTFANNGLVISDGNLVSLDVSVTSDFVVGGVTFGTQNLELVYVPSSETFTLSGTAYAEAFDGLAQLNVTFGVLPKAPRAAQATFRPSRAWSSRTVACRVFT